MASRFRSQRLTGQYPLSYIGVNPVSPSNFVIDNRAPTPTDAQNFFIGDIWLDNSAYPAAPGADNIWMLVSLTGGVATWVRMAGAGDIQTLTGNTGGPVGPDAAHNINTVGDNIGITVAGNPGTNTLTWSLVGGGGGVATQSFHTDDNNVEVPIGTVVIPPVGSVGQINIVHSTAPGNLFSNTGTQQGPDIHSVGIFLDNSIIQPFTNNTGTAGMYSLGVTDLVTDRFLHGFGQTNTFVGRQSGNLTMNTANANTNTCVGNLTGNSLVGAVALQGTLNTLLGSASGRNVTNGSANVFVGATSGNLATTAGDNCAVGVSSLGAILTGSGNCTVGFDSGNNYVAAESNNVVLGFSNVGRVGENNTIRMGAIGGAAGTENIFIGRDTGTSAYTVANAKNNVFIGSTAGGAALTTGSQNTIVGSMAGNGGLTTAANNCFFGYQAGSGYTTTENNNINIGTNTVGQVGEIGVIRIDSTATGGGFAPIFIGGNSGNITYNIADATFNTAVGSLTLTAVTTGGTASAFGHGALNRMTTADDCTAVGYLALEDLTTGINNTAVGSGALANVLTGIGNVAVGYLAGTAYNGAETDNIIIGDGVGGTVGESHTLRIAQATGAGGGQLNRAFICGIRGIVTGVNDAVAVLVDSANQLGTVSSSKEFKDNIKDMASYSDVLYQLRPVVFNYKQHPSDVISSGLIAEEVEQVCPRLVAYQEEKPLSVKYHDLPAMLLNEVQKLEKRVSELEKRCVCQK